MGTGERDITRFTDYRGFLELCFKEKRALDRKFSFQYYATRLQTTRGYLSQVMRKRRHISLDKVSKVSKLFGFSDFEREYFLYLYLMSQTKDVELRTIFRTCLTSLSHRTFGASQSPRRQDLSLEGVLTKVIAAWRHDLMFVTDAQWIRENLRPGIRMSLKQVQNALKQFEASELSKGRGPVLSSALVSESDRFKSYREGLQLAQGALSESPARPDQVTAQLFCSLEPAQWAQVQECKKRYLAELADLLGTFPSQANASTPYLHLYSWIPLSKNSETK